MKKHAVALLTALCVAAGCTASADTAKHERVYVVVNHDGEVQTCWTTFTLKMVTRWMCSRIARC